MVIFLISLFFLSGCTKKQTSFLKKDEFVLSEHGSDNYKLIVKNSAQTNCSEKKQIKKIVSKTKPLVLKQKTYKSVEAGLVDVPTPLLAQPIRGCTDEKGSYRLEYSIKLSVDQVAAFYTTEMERSGWDKGMLFSSDDQTVLSFKKRTSSCVILLIPKSSWWRTQKKTHAFLYVS